MQDWYKDNPQKIEQWINSLTDDEQAIFDQGYICCMQGFLEQIVESKRKIFKKIMDHHGDDKIERELMSRIHILDIYETHYAKRIDNLVRRVANV